jgi:DNA polymerase delta subunit 2
VDVLGISGQGVAEIMQYTNLASPVDAMELCMNARHLAPTAPDTLACYPITGDVDPLIIDTGPHLFISGNSAAGCECRVVNGVLCVSLSAFSETAEVVVVNVADPLVDWRIVCFDAPDY